MRNNQVTPPRPPSMHQNQPQQQPQQQPPQPTVHQPTVHQPTKPPQTALSPHLELVKRRIDLAERETKLEKAEAQAKQELEQLLSDEAWILQLQNEVQLLQSKVSMNYDIIPNESTSLNDVNLDCGEEKCQQCWNLEPRKMAMKKIVKKLSETLHYEKYCHSINEENEFIRARERLKKKRLLVASRNKVKIKARTALVCRLLHNYENQRGKIMSCISNQEAQLHDFYRRKVDVLEQFNVIDPVLQRQVLEMNHYEVDQFVNEQLQKRVIDQCNANSKAYGAQKGGISVEYRCEQLGKQIHFRTEHYTHLLPWLFPTGNNLHINPWDPTITGVWEPIFQKYWKSDVDSGKVPKLGRGVKLYFSTPDILGGNWVEFYPKTKLLELDPNFQLTVGSLCNRKSSHRSFTSVNCADDSVDLDRKWRNKEFTSKFQISIKWKVSKKKSRGGSKRWKQKKWN